MTEEPYKIESGIPIPPIAAGKDGMQKRGSRYPIEKLRVGDSFLYLIDESDPRSELDKLRLAQSRFGVLALRVKRRTGRLFTTQRVRESGKWGLRVWRLA